MLGGLRAIHLLVHGGQEGNRGRGGETDRRHQIIGHACRHAGDQIGGRRGEDHQVGPFSELNMAHGRFRRRIEQAVGNRIAGYRLQAEWGDERFCRLRHCDTHFRAAFT